MKTNLFALLIITLFSIQKMNSASKKILNDIRKYYNSKEFYQIKFEYSLNNMKQKTHQTEIGIFYSNRRKYNISIFGINQIFDGEKKYQISHENKEIIISSIDLNDKITPIKIFDIDNKEFIIKKKQFTKIKGLQSIKLVPSNSKNQTRDFVIIIDVNKKQLIQITDTQKTGSIITLKVLDFDDITQLNPNLFIFDKDKYKGYEIIDLD